MPINNIATYTLFKSLINDVSKVEGDLTDAQIQLSSGQKSQDFTGIANQAQQYLSIDAILRKTDQYITDNALVETRVNATANVLDQSITTANTLLNLIAQRRTGISNNAAFVGQVQNLWQQVASQLNSTVENQYIFSGTKTTTSPVDSTTFPTLLNEGVPDAGYYKGSQQNMTAHPTDNVSITYNVRADDIGFQRIIASMVTAVQGHAESSDEMLSKAYDLVKQGIQDLINTQANVNATKVQYININKDLANQKLYWKGIQEAIGNTDVVAVSTQVAINQGILQSAFQAFAKISALNLAQFLR